MGRLVDKNFLKPVTWAEDKNGTKKNFAASLGISGYLRPLYLYTKLYNLKNVNAVALKDVQALKSMDKSTAQKTPDETQTEYKNEKNACDSCKILFENKESIKLEKSHITYFGNCAEFDIVRTENSEQKLHNIKATEVPWGNFKTECEEHIKAFKEFKNKVPELQKEDMRAYYEKTKNTNLKALKYKWSDCEKIYELVTCDRL